MSQSLSQLWVHNLHHQKYNFQEELRKFLAQHDVAYNEKYIWD